MHALNAEKAVKIFLAAFPTLYVIAYVLFAYLVGASTIQFYLHWYVIIKNISQEKCIRYKSILCKSLLLCH